jgi:FlaA1/EpsC-like NDP-sugar epimerase
MAFVFSIVLRFGSNWLENLYQYRIIYIYLSLSYIIFAIIFKLYSRVWSYISISDLFLIAKTITATVMAWVLYFNLGKGIYFPWTVKTLTWFISISLIAGSKLLWRLYWEGRTRFKRREERILIVGAGDAGEIICREIEKRKDLGVLAGFVDDDREKIGKKFTIKKY